MLGVRTRHLFSFSFWAAVIRRAVTVACWRPAMRRACWVGGCVYVCLFSLPSWRCQRSEAVAAATHRGVIVGGSMRRKVLCSYAVPLQLHLASLCWPGYSGQTTVPQLVA